MPWRFTLPLNVGDLDPNAPAGEYTHCWALVLGNCPDVEPPLLRCDTELGLIPGGSIT